MQTVNQYIYITNVINNASNISVGINRIHFYFQLGIGKDNATKNRQLDTFTKERITISTK